MFYCDKCEFKSCTSYGLVFHRSKIHKITKLMQRFTCGYCWSKFTAMSHFKTHILKKHLELEGGFSCEFCSFKTFDKCYLNKHTKNHELRGELIKTEKSLDLTQENSNEALSDFEEKDHMTEDKENEFDLLKKDNFPLPHFLSPLIIDEAR